MTTTLPWVILDRDGVINEDSDAYIKSVDEWHPVEGSVDAIAALSKAGLHIAVATNQSGLARKLFDEATLFQIHQHMLEKVEAAGGNIDGIFMCPHGPDDGCHCRKPNTGLLEAIEDEFEIDLTGVPFVGDTLKDLLAARKHGCKPVLVLSGKGQRTFDSIADDDEWQGLAVFPTLASFANDFLADRA